MQNVMTLNQKNDINNLCKSIKIKLIKKTIEKKSISFKLMKI